MQNGKDLFRIRAAVENDVVQMMDLIKELAAFERAPEAVSVSLEAFKEAGFGKKPVWRAIVAENKESDMIVGLALFYIRYSTWKGKQLYLEDIIVNRRFRGMGIGKRLMLQLVELAKGEGLQGMVWQVLDWNDSAIRFYKRFPNTTFDEQWINVKLEV